MQILCSLTVILADFAAFHADIVYFQETWKKEPLHFWRRGGVSGAAGSLVGSDGGGSRQTAAADAGRERIAIKNFNFGKSYFTFLIFCAILQIEASKALLYITFYMLTARCTRQLLCCNNTQSDLCY